MKAEKRAAKAKRKRDTRGVEMARDEAERRLAYDRDGGKCRATGRWMPFKHASVLRAAHSHHVVFRSAGGDGSLKNRLTVCAEIHDMLHRHILEVSGNPNSRVRFRQRNQETGQIEREWEG